MHKGEPEVIKKWKWKRFPTWLLFSQLALKSAAAALRMLEDESEVQPTFQEDLFCKLIAIRRLQGICLHQKALDAQR